MKKNTKIILMLCMLFSANVYAEMTNPFKLQAGVQKMMGYSYATYKFYALEDGIVVTDIIVNKGKCKSDEGLSLRMNYGDNIYTGDQGKITKPLAPQGLATGR